MLIVYPDNFPPDVWAATLQSVDPTALVEVINRTPRRAADDELANLPEVDAITDAAIHAMIDHWGMLIECSERLSRTGSANSTST